MFMTDLVNNDELLGCSTDLNSRLGIKDSNMQKVYRNDLEDDENVFMSPNPFEVAQDLKQDDDIPLQVRPELYNQTGLSQIIPSRESDNCDFGAHNLITGD